MDNQRKEQPDQEEPPKCTALKNYRPITGLLMMWKILTAQIRRFLMH